MELASWTVEIRRLEVFEMRCLRAILGISIRERIRNAKVRRMLDMETTIIDVIRKKRLRWFGHVVRRPSESYVSKAYRQDFTNRRPRGRPAKRWTDQIKSDTGLPLLTAERRATDRRGWRRESGLVGARGGLRLGH